MKVIETDCRSCKISKNCPEKGGIPLIHNKKPHRCAVYNGYAGTEIDKEALSKESTEIAEKNGYCVSIVGKPYIEDGEVKEKILKIFHDKILHPRQKARNIESHLQKSPGFNKLCSPIESGGNA